MPSEKGLRLFLGPDRARKLQRIQSLEQALGIHALDYHNVDGSRISSADLVSLCRQHPAAGSARLIVVNQANRLRTECIAALIEHRETIAKTACVVLLVEASLKGNHALARIGGEIAIERFQARDLTAAKPFALLDAIGARDVAGAVSALRDQTTLGKEPIELLGLVTWQIQRWVAVKRLLGLGYDIHKIATAAGLSPWQALRARDEIAQRSLPSLRGLLRRSWQIDRDIKRGRMLAGLAVEQLVIEACLATSRE